MEEVLSLATAAKRKLLFLGLGYADVEQETSLYTELVEELTKAGAEVRVVAPALDSNRAGLRTEGGFSVLRVASGSLFQTGLIRKGLNNLFLPFRYYLVLRKFIQSWQPEWILTPTPPITLTPLVWWLKRKTGAQSYLILRDIFPQNAVDLGFMSRFGAVYWAFRFLEKWTYAISDHIGCMSPGNIDYVRQHNSGLDDKKLHMLPNWIAERHVVVEENPAETRKRWGVAEQDLLCVFGGNLGKPQQVEFLAEVAQVLSDEPRIRMAIIGQGTESAKLENLILEHRLNNLVLRDRLPRDEYQRLLGAADVGLILLSEHFTIPNIPSRLTGYWAAGVGILASTDVATDLNEAFLSKYGGGEWVKMGDVIGFASKLRGYADKPALMKEMGNRGRKVILEHFTAKKAAETVLARLETFS